VVQVLEKKGSRYPKRGRDNLAADRGLPGGGGKRGVSSEGRGIPLEEGVFFVLAIALIACPLGERLGPFILRKQEGRKGDRSRSN